MISKTDNSGILLLYGKCYVNTSVFIEYLLYPSPRNTNQTKHHLYLKGAHSSQDSS